MNDWSLLSEYVRSGSETAFESLVRRHLNMVYSAALRQAGQVEVAEEVSQAVFVLLARKAPKLTSSVLVPGWLYRTACFMARRSVENQARRRAIENEAAKMNLLDTKDEVWSRILPHVDAAMSDLGEMDRNALVLRFLQQRSFREVAESLGMSEDAAKKRVTRALDKLRNLLDRRGVTVTLTAIAAALTANSVEAAPVTLGGLTVKAALGTGLAKSSAVGLLVEESARAILLIRLKKVALLAAAALVLITSVIKWDGRNLVTSKSPQGDELRAAIKQTPPRQLQVFAPAKPAKTKGLTLHIVAAETGAPLAEGVVFARFSAPQIRSRNYSTQPEPGISFPIDSLGAARIPLPEERFKGMQLWVTSPGRVPVSIQWKREEELNLPSDYSVRLGEGTRIGGTILDENGKSVVGATLSFPETSTVRSPWDSRESVAYNTPATTPRTDNNGRWIADFISSETDGTLDGYVTAAHSDYVKQTLSLRNLLAAGTTNTLVMKKGCLISGSVIDTAGNPIFGASIDLAFMPGADSPAAPTAMGIREIIQTGRIEPGFEPFVVIKKTDEFGLFQFARVHEGLYRLRAETEGFSKTNFNFIAEAITTNFLIALAPANEPANSAKYSIVRGRVTDDEGQPVKKAIVLLAPGQPGLERLAKEWYDETDDQGKFEWKHAPDRSVRLTIRGSAADGDLEQQSVELAPDGSEPVIILKSKAKMLLRLIVTDQETGKPLPSFKVAVGESTPRREKGLTGLELIGEGHDGKFALRLPQRESLSSSGMMARYGVGRSKVVVRALGYFDKEFPAPDQTNDLEFAITLDRALPMSGRVNLPSGLPAAGAEVSLLPTGTPLSITKDGKFRFGNQPGCTSLQTGPDGTFHAQPTGLTALLASTHESGWAILPMPDSGESVIQLRPWSRIDGKVGVGGRPARVEVRVRPLLESSGHPGGILTTFTDTAGRFEFPKLPDGRVLVYFMLPMNSQPFSGMSGGSHPQVLSLVPGETTTVLIGGSGARLAGRAVLSSGVGPVAWTQITGGLYSKSENSSLAEIGYPFDFRADGSFVIEDVPPGDYQLKTNPPPPTDSIIRNVTIPESLAHGGDLDLGTIEVSWPWK